MPAASASDGFSSQHWLYDLAGISKSAGIQIRSGAVQLACPGSGTFCRLGGRRTRAGGSLGLGWPVGFCALVAWRQGPSQRGRCHEQGQHVGAMEFRNVSHVDTIVHFATSNSI